MNRSFVGRLTAAAVLCTALSAAPATAQSPLPFAVEARGGVAFPTGDLAAHARNGVGYGAGVVVQLLPNYGVYGAWSRAEFDLDARDGRVVDSGFAVGLSGSYPGLLGGGLAPWLASGLIFHDLDVEGAATPAGDTTLGFEVAGGLAVPLGPRVRITPGIGYRLYNAPFLDDASARVSYLSADIGLNVSF